MTTSKLLTTGVDVQTCKNIALVRVIESMIEFKQIIGRGTRVRDDYGKYFFTILDYTGSATRLFADPEFDGEPALITEEEIERRGKGPDTKDRLGDKTMRAKRTRTGRLPQSPMTPRESQKILFRWRAGGDVAHLVYELDAEGKQLRVVKYTDYTAERCGTSTPRLLNCENAGSIRRKVRDIERLDERGINFEELAAATNQPEADPFDLLCHMAFNSPLRTRRERADRFRREKKDFFVQYGPEAKAILNELLDKYTDHGTAQFIIPDVLKVPPISRHGNVIEIASFFGGPEQLREAVNQLQTLLYAA